MNTPLSWTIERDDHDDFVLWWWTRFDHYCARNHAVLDSKNFTDAIAEAKYLLNIE